MTWNTAHQHIVLCSSLFTAILGIKTFYLFQLEVHFLFVFQWDSWQGKVLFKVSKCGFLLYLKTSSAFLL